MIAVRFGGAARFVAVASPDYLAGRAAPRTPDDLRTHACIRVRMPSGKLYRWEFERHGQELAVDVPGPLTLDHPELMAEAAAAGLGIAYVSDRLSWPFLERGVLVTVLDAWCPAILGLFLYYPGHRHVPPGLRAFIDVLKEVH
jgi:DNA-binding transcriptional LysR family regulator